MTKRTKRVEELLRAALAAQHTHPELPKNSDLPPVEKGDIAMEERKPGTIAEEPEKEREEETPGTSSKVMLEDGDVVRSLPAADSLGSATALDRRRRPSS